MRDFAAAALLSLALATPAFAQQAPLAPGTGPRHAIAMHGDIKYPADYRNFAHVNPNAPKGGDVRFHAIGTFDSLNPWIIRGTATGLVGLTVETLMVSSDDEPFTMYCLICRDGRNARRPVVGRIRAARGGALPRRQRHRTRRRDLDVRNAEGKGRPFYRSYYGDVVRVEKTGPRKVRFVFRNGENRELALIVGQAPVLARNGGRAAISSVR